MTSELVSSKEFDLVWECGFSAETKPGDIFALNLYLVRTDRKTRPAFFIAVPWGCFYCGWNYRFAGKERTK